MYVAHSIFWHINSELFLWMRVAQIFEFVICFIKMPELGKFGKSGHPGLGASRGEGLCTLDVMVIKSNRRIRVTGFGEFSPNFGPLCDCLL
jgi:hypothetical protein